ncbi:hypothetical protein SAMN04488029_0681 [Reichenbachiella faecimaris]|uniref:Uncharacterized protein n=1 Tax=Reichenbachiella faecimaris TaxID=692418 RepID=A0A1W2G7S2_REIFA|nr:hypothetical protein SAMN04488029_0681 [Reichenbachiella faecimaris]
MPTAVKIIYCVISIKLPLLATDSWQIDRPQKFPTANVLIVKLVVYD